MMSSRPHMSIDSWLEKLDLSLYRNFFKEYSAVEDILWMSEQHLKDIGIKHGGHRAQIISSLTVLRDKYNKLSKECFDVGKSRLKPEDKNKSFSSLSPVSQVKIEKTHSGVRSWPSSVPSSSPHSNLSSPRLSMGGCSTDMTADELKQALEKELSLDSSDLRSHAWYHGTILRQRAEELVMQDGDFLVRDCISQPGDFVITCKWKSVPLHFIIRKIILNPDMLYERVQYCFEKDCFDSIPNFVTYHVGGKHCLSETSGVIISNPINRTMPLTYYTSRFGVQCQIHYAAKKLETLPPESDSRLISQPNSHSHIQPSIKTEDDKSEHKTTLYASEPKCSPILLLTRVGSDPMLSPSTQRKKLEHRPHSGSFTSEIKLLSETAEDKPPPKPSRVPSKKYSQKPVIVKKFRTSSIDEENETFLPEDTMKIEGISQTHKEVTRQSSETRFSFLDRPSIPEDTFEPELFTLPSLNSFSIFNPHEFKSFLLSEQNLPLEGTVLSKVKEIILRIPSQLLACNLTWMDLEAAKNAKEMDLGLGVTSGLELFLLPQGEQLQKDLLERTECLKLFVAITLLTTPVERERVELLKKWIDVAIETKTSNGNLFGFTSIILGLTIPQITGLHSTWLSLRHLYTDSAITFETKLRPAFTALQQATGMEAPNTCLPYLLSLLLILQKHKNTMDLVEQNIFEEGIYKNIPDLEIPGCVNCSDYGLQLLENHLEIGRYIIQQCPVFLQSGNITIQQMMLENSLLDIFSTEFHLRILWGFRGAVVNSRERHEKFKKVLVLLHNKCYEKESQNV